jgi:hypothetical protein
MINGAHVILYSHDADADRAMLRDVLGFPSVDAGGGWLIFALPPAEVAVHPTGDDFAAERGILPSELYLMCDDLHAAIDALAARGVRCTGVDQAPWGMKTTIILPSGGEIGLYQPRHPTALGLAQPS